MPYGIFSHDESIHNTINAIIMTRSKKKVATISVVEKQTSQMMQIGELITFIVKSCFFFLAHRETVHE